MASQTEEFLTRILPWGNEPGYRNIHWMWYTGEFDEKGKEKKGTTGAACQTIDEALQEVNRRWRNDVYVCLSVQQHRRDKKKPDQKYYPASKSQRDALFLKAFWFDFDIDPADPAKYPDTATAGRELGAFCRKTGLPVPQIFVKSGYGVHAYWIIDRLLTPQEWQPVANGLKDAALKLGLKIDATCTADAARIMRVPGSKNWKDKANPRDCTLVRNDPQDYGLPQLQAPLAGVVQMQAYAQPAAQPLVGAIAGSMAGAFQAMAKPQVDEFGGGLPDIHKAIPVSFETAAQKCAAFREALDTGGERHSNPLWNAMLYAAAFDPKGRDVAHKVSEKHPGYVQSQTDAEFDRKAREIAQTNKGWPSCAFIEGAGGVGCAGCPLKGPKSSPFHFGRSDDDLPKNYRRNEVTGYIEVSRPQEDGSFEWVMLSRCGMRDAYIEDDPIHGRVLHFTKVERRTAPRLVSLLQSEVQGRTLDSKLGHFGIACTPKTKAQFQEFFVAWIEQLKEQQGASRKAAPYGWNAVNGEVKGFAFDGTLYHAGGKEDTSRLDHGMREKYKTSGKYDTWKKAADFIIGQGRQDLATLIAASFAAPLVRFTGHTGVTLSAWSGDSGIGKSSALKVGQAVWGDPIAGMGQLTDTVNSALHKAGAIRNLPLYWDEIKTDKQIGDFVSLAFQLAIGKEKDRLTSEVKMRTAGTWETMLVAASNASLVDKVAAHQKNSPAGSVRIFEFEVLPKPLPVPPHQATEIIAAVNQNYGHVGAKYAEWLGANADHAKQTVERFGKLLATATPTTTEERFWTGAICAVMAGARIAKDLGFCDFDMGALWGFMLKTLQDNRSMKRVSAGDLNNPVYAWQMVQDFLQARWNRSILVTDVMQAPPGRPGGAVQTVEVKNPDAGTRLQAIDVRWAEKDQKVRILRTSLYGWLDQQAMGRQEFVRAILRHFGGSQVRANLTSGTGLGVRDNRQDLIELQIPAFALGGGGGTTSPSASPGSEQQIAA